MGRDFAHHHEAHLDADPEQVWQAVATGPGIGTWFLGRTTVTDGEVRTGFGDIPMPAGTITARDRPARFAYRTDGDDGRFVAYEYLIEGRAGSGTVLRTVTSGFLPGDDWADEYEAMAHGTALFFTTLVTCLRHFPGRTATPVTAFGPPVGDWPATWSALRARVTAGTVIADGPHALAVRTPHAVHRYLRGFHGSLVAAHAIFDGDTDPAPWTALLTDVTHPKDRPCPP